jgi:NADH-quinone oxidoreductase subunit I
MKAFFIAIGNLFRKPVTIKYPYEPTYIPDDFRGLIEHHPDLCIWCRRCEMACPSGAIIFSQALTGEQTYHYNRGVCIYCGECVRSCPKPGAIIQTPIPSKPALKGEDINNSWKITVEDSLASRAAYMAEKKKQANNKDSEGNSSQQ